MRAFRTVALAKGCDLAEGLLNGGEAGLLHLRALSHVVGRKIRVWDSAGHVLGIFDSLKWSKRKKYTYYCYQCLLKGKCDTCQNGNFESAKLYVNGNSFNRDILTTTNENCKLFGSKKGFTSGYLELKYQSFDNGTGHWVTTCGEDILSRRIGYYTQRNDCLFVAVCQQCRDYEPKSLRLMTASVLRRQDFVIEYAFPQFRGAGVVLLGGAKYDGSDPQHARAILDESQGTRGHRHVARAHPRGHASHPGATGDMDSVENYSRSSTRDFPKSAWMSRMEQDSAVHQLLLTREAQNGMDRLNSGETRIPIKMVPGFEIQVGLWAEGVMFSGPFRAESVTILLQHHEGKQDIANANVQVFTCYPVAPRGVEKGSLSIPKNPSLKRTLELDDDDEENEKKSRRYFL